MLAASLLTVVLGIGSIQPARADGAASTRNIILGAAAVAAGIIIGRNVAHKRELATTVAGYTTDGGTVFADGRVVYANGASYYPGDQGQQIACRHMSCAIFDGDGATYNGYSQWNGSGWVAPNRAPDYGPPPQGHMPPPNYGPPQNNRYETYGADREHVEREQKREPGSGAPCYNAYSAYASAYNAYYEAYKAYYKAYYESYNSLRYETRYRTYYEYKIVRKKMKHRPSHAAPARQRRPGGDPDR